MARFDAVIFDLYETLITEFDPHWRAGPTTAERLGIPEGTFERIWQARRLERMTSPLEFPDVLAAACRAAGITADPEVIEALARERRAGKARAVTTADPGVIDLLRRLRAGGLRLGMVSNCAVEEVAAWPDSPYAGLFDDVTFSCQVGVAKPDRAIYRHACGNLGVPPERTVFIGDGGSDELAGAEAAGLTALRARWFLDRWPQAIRDRHPRFGVPDLESPADVLTILG